MEKTVRELARNPLIQIAAAVLLPVIVGTILNLTVPLGDRSPGELFAVGLFGGVLLDVLIALGVAIYAIERRYTFIPGEKDGDRFDADTVLPIIQALRKVPDPTSHERPLVAQVLRGAILEEIEEIADPDTDGIARFSSTRLRSLYAALKLHLGDQHEIWATCFTDMSEFWARREIGKEYLEFNLRLLRDNNVRMKRIFGLSSPSAYSNDGLKTQLLRILRGFGCDLRVFNMDQRDDEKDQFLIVEKSAGGGEKALLALEWVVEGERVKQINVVYDRDRLSILENNFRRTLDRSSAVSWTRVEEESARRSIADSLKSWENITQSATANQISYLSTAAAMADAGQIADYWRNLQGSLIRPSAAGVAQLHAKLAALSRSGATPANVLILGCTPEVRAAVAWTFPMATVRCADLDFSMYRAMTSFVRGASRDDLALPATIDDVELAAIRVRVDQQKSLSWNWLDLSQRDDRYDLIIGVDVINMLPHDSWDDFLEVLRKILNDHGQVFMQVVIKPEGELRRTLAALDGGNDLVPAYLQLEEKIRTKEITIGDAFSRLMLSTVIHDPDPILKVGTLLREVETIERILSRYKPNQTPPLYRRFQFCNSQLALRDPAYLEGTLRRQFNVESSWDNKPDYTGAFSWYWLTPRANAS